MAEKGAVITKTVWQRSQPLPEETMEFLRGIAADYGKVKNSVYERYAGIRSLKRLASVFDIQTEMRHCGLREQLGLPSVYYELAVRDAVSDIKGMWGIVKNKIRTCIAVNEALSADDRMYVRTVLKLDAIYGAVLEGGKHPMPEKTAELSLDTKRLDNLLRRLTRRFLKKPKVGQTDSFRVAPAGYAYRDGQLFLVSRKRRQRVALPLKDQKTGDRQIQVFVREDCADIAIPLDVRVKKHEDFRNSLYIHLGFGCMCTLSSGAVYGERLGELSSAKTERLTEKNRGRSRMRAKYRESLAAGDHKKAAAIEANNLGHASYDRQKQRERAKLETYINTEINRMLAEEKPATIVVTKPITAGRSLSKNRPANRKLTGSLQGYVRKRLAEKCSEHSVALVEISSRDTGSVCSECGTQGERKKGVFYCESCGYTSAAALNSARNLERKYDRVKSCAAGNEHPL